MYEVADGNTAQGIAKGTVSTQPALPDGQGADFEFKAEYVPGLRKNLISVGELARAGNRTEMVGGQARVYDPNGTLSAVFRLTDDNLYELVTTSEDIGSANAVTLTDLHKAMGHVSRKALLRAIKKGQIADLPQDLDLNAPIEPCDGCDRRGPKKTKKPKSTTTRATVYGERIFGDLSVVNTKTLGGYSYYLVLVDDWNREGTVYLLRHKSDCVQAVIDHLAMIKNRTGRELTFFRSDNESSFTANDFGRMLLDKGITHELTTPGNSFQNGVAERRIQTLDRSFTAAKALTGAPDGFWGKGIHYTNFLWNDNGSSANPDNESPN
jgi:transposase InsO family protein